jgi:hypothetical protein
MIAVVRQTLALCLMAILAYDTLAAGPAAGSSKLQSAPLLPAPAAPPTLDELNAMLASLSKVPFADPAKQPAVIRLDDDWLTKGDCLGRVGRYWSCFCSIVSPRNYVWGAGPEPIEYRARINPKFDKTDSLRHWLHWMYTQNQNTLELPPTYLHSRVLQGYTTWDMYRRQAEWDDHGETYPMSIDGPSLYCSMKVPAGLYYLSLYNFNKDGHGGGEPVPRLPSLGPPAPGRARPAGRDGLQAATGVRPRPDARLLGRRL